MELLTTLYSIDSKSGSEESMIEFITNHVHDLGLEVILDAKQKNLYITKGESDTYPCVVAHLDEVHRPNPNKTVVTCEDLMFGYDFERKHPTGIGADDKNGIWIALKMLEKYDNIKVAFFSKEEIGCVGSSHANMDFFDDCRFVIQCDRRGNSNFIKSIGTSELCSEEFIKDCNLENFGYKTTSGLSTDVGALKRNGLKVCCCNLSCGYYNPHSDIECTDVNDLHKCLEFVDYILANLTKVYLHTKKIPVAPQFTLLFDDDDFDDLMDAQDYRRISKSRRKKPVAEDKKAKASQLLKEYFATFKDKKAIPQYAWLFWEAHKEELGMSYLDLSALYNQIRCTL